MRTRAQTHGRTLTEKRKVRASLARLGWLHCGPLNFAARTFRKLPWGRGVRDETGRLLYEICIGAARHRACRKKKKKKRNHRMSYSPERDPAGRHAESIFPPLRRCRGARSFRVIENTGRIVLKDGSFLSFLKIFYFYISFLDILTLDFLLLYMRLFLLNIFNKLNINKSLIKIVFQNYPPHIFDHSKTASAPNILNIFNLLNILYFYLISYIFVRW